MNDNDGVDGLNEIKRSQHLPIKVRSEMHRAGFRTAGSVGVNVDNDNEKKEEEEEEK
jgi:hypothetical protein